MVVVLAIAAFSFNAIKNIKVDIFPEVELPAMYIAMPYGGLSPAYMDGFMANEFQKVLLFVSGVQNIDFKSVQGLSLMKLTFYPGTDMAQAAGEVSTQVSRAMGFALTAIPCRSANWSLRVPSVLLLSFRRWSSPKSDPCLRLFPESPPRLLSVEISGLLWSVLTRKRCSQTD